MSMRFAAALSFASALGCAAHPAIVEKPQAAPLLAAAAAPAPPLAATAEPVPPAPSCPVQKRRTLSEPPQLIEPERRVPDFRLATSRCEIFDSRELVGKRPFVVVFFASWCSVCEYKVPLIRQAVKERGGELTALFVSLDETEGWSATEAFLARHGLLPESAVPGRDHLDFSFGYNPFRSVPVVVVVGRSGRIVDVQIGSRHGDDYRLGQAIDMAIEEAPERLLTSFPRR